MFNNPESNRLPMISECREAGLLHSSREQEIRNRAYEIYLQRGGNLAMSWRTGCGPKANSQRISLVARFYARTLVLVGVCASHCSVRIKRPSETAATERQERDQER